jgi:purine-cytosine permease-like protein
VIAMTAGMTVAALTMKSPLYDGPIALALGGADLSWILGFPVAALCYWALTSMRDSPAAVRGVSRQRPT